MRPAALLCAMIAILAGCTSLSSSAPPTDLKSALHGLWAELYTAEGEILTYMYYLPEGKFHAYGYLEESKNEFWFAFGNWKMKGDQSCINFLFDTYGVMDPNEELCVQVVSVNNDVFIYRDNDDGETHTLRRVSTGWLPK